MEPTEEEIDAYPGLWHLKFEDKPDEEPIIEDVLHIDETPIEVE